MRPIRTAAFAALTATLVVACSTGSDPSTTAAPSTVASSTSEAPDTAAPTTSAAPLTMPPTTVAPTTLTLASTSVPATATTLPTVAALPYPTGLSDSSLDVNGVERRYRVHVPAGLVQPRAVVVVLHGGGGEGLGVADAGEHPLSVFRAVADREGFVVVYPEGLPARDRAGNRGWVDCRSDNTVASGADDIAFLATLTERVRAELRLTSEQVFMAGGSNGAQMTLAFAFHRPELVGAVAAGSGNLPERPLPGPCTIGPGKPVPIVLVHGTADIQMPYDGGCVADIGGACNRGRVVSAEATRDRWLEINGLVGVEPTVSVVDLDPGDAGPANHLVYAGSAPVEWWRLDSAGHTVASRTVLIEPNRLTGAQNRDIEFAEVAWAFFASRLPPAS